MIVLEKVPDNRPADFTSTDSVLTFVSAELPGWRPDGHGWIQQRKF